MEKSIENQETVEIEPVFDDEMKLTKNGKEALLEEIDRESKEKNLGMEEVISLSNQKAEEAFYAKKEEDEKKHIEQFEAKVKQEIKEKRIEREEEQFTSEEIGFISKQLDYFEKQSNKLMINPDAIISKNDSDDQYSFSGEKFKKGGLFRSGDGKETQLRYLGRLADNLGFDLSQGMAVKDIVNGVKERLSKNNPEEADLEEQQKQEERKGVLSYHQGLSSLLSLKESGLKTFFQSDKSFVSTGEMIKTQGDVRSEIVTKKGEKYLKVPVHLGGGGDPGHQRTKYHYVHYDKAKSLMEQF